MAEMKEATLGKKGNRSKSRLTKDLSIQELVDSQWTTPWCHMPRAWHANPDETIKAGFKQKL